LLDVGSLRDVDAGDVLAEEGEPSPLFMVLHGMLLVEGEQDSYERGAGAIVGYVEDMPRVTAVTDARVVVITRADYEAALTG
jgi:CRP-like cAMP-binding protein